MCNNVAWVLIKRINAFVNKCYQEIVAIGAYVCHRLNVEQVDP